MRQRLTALIIAALLCCPPAAAQAEFWGRDRWWGQDKALHLLVGLAIGGGCSAGMWWLDRDDPAALRAGLCAGFGQLPGVGKELYDSGRPNNFFSVKDLLWTSLGVLIGVATGWLIERLTRDGSTSKRSSASLRGAPLIWRF
jgi:uncharacterized protein YfiM (DUF2279 family)